MMMVTSSCERRMSDVHMGAVLRVSRTCCTVICPAGHGGQQEELLASQCTASQRPTRMCSHVCIDHRKPYVYPRVLHRSVITFSTRSCAHRHLRAHTTSQLPYSVCEARSLLELRREVAREGTEDRVAIALVVLVQCRLVRLHQRAANTSRRSRARHFTRRYSGKSHYSARGYRKYHSG